MNSTKHLVRFRAPYGLQGEIIITESVSHIYTFEATISGQHRSYESHNAFRALIELRKDLEAEGKLLLCGGARIDAWPVGMASNMGDGRYAYKLQIGRTPAVTDLVDIFAPAEACDVGTLQQQFDHRERWFAHVHARAEAYRAAHPLTTLSILLALILLPLLLTGCRSTPPTPTSRPTPTQAFPPRPITPPLPVKLFHQDNDTLTLTTVPTATDDQIAAILWQFRDAAHTHTFAALNLPQSFIDARKPTVWFHIYRGPKCAAEKYTRGPLPCEASYHGAGDFTLGSYTDPNWADGILRHADDTETKLWNPDAPYASK